MASLPDDDPDRNPLDGITRMLEAHLALLRGPHGREQLLAAFGYWQCYPLVDCRIRDVEGATRTAVYEAQMNLNRVHSKAVDRLMREAERAGLDSSPLHEAGRVCRELFSTPALYEPHRRGGLYETWPDCLGPARYQLPPEMQEAIRTGEATFRRLAAVLEISPEGAAQGVEAKTLSEPAGSEPAGAEEPPAASQLSAKDLAVLLRKRGFAKATNDAVYGYLRRYAQDHSDCCFQVPNPKRNEPRILYRIPEVWPVLIKQYGHQG